jgi:hypothetical protein
MQIKKYIDDAASPWSSREVDTTLVAESTARLVAALDAKGIDMTDSIAKWTKAAAKR